MKDLYKRLGIIPTSDIVLIGGKINALSFSKDAQDAQCILLDKNKKAIYDRNRDFCAFMAQIRFVLNLNSTGHWNQTEYGDFIQSEIKRQEKANSATGNQRSNYFRSKCSSDIQRQELHHSKKAAKIVAFASVVIFIIIIIYIQNLETPAHVPVQFSGGGGTGRERMDAAANQDDFRVQPARSNPSSYTVVQGDTLSSIAIRFNIDLDELISANAATYPNPDIISVGDPIVIPGSHIVNDTHNEFVLPPLPHTGIISKNFSNGNAQLEILASREYNAYIKVVFANNSSNVLFTAFIRRGARLDINIPLGVYRIRFATGIDWYGNDKFFGPSTQTNVSGRIDISEVDAQYTVELIVQENGNLSVSPISLSEF